MDANGREWVFLRNEANLGVTQTAGICAGLGRVWQNEANCGDRGGVLKAAANGREWTRMGIFAKRSQFGGDANGRICAGLGRIWHNEAILRGQGGVLKAAANGRGWR
jgi:hypothetical protein